MSDYEVVVVGAGPAGCTAASALGKRKKVLLIDAAELPRKKPCGGALNPYSWEFLRKFGVPERIMLDPRIIHFRFVDWDRGIARRTELEFKNVSREDFDEWLLSLMPEGIKVLPKTSLIGLEVDGRGVQLRVMTDGVVHVVKADYVVGADGPNSRARKFIGDDVQRYIAIQDWVKNPADIQPYFDCIGTSSISRDFGYGYVMPKGDHTLVGSVFYPGTTGVKKKHERLVSLIREHYVPIGATIKRESALAVCLKSPKDMCLGGERVLLAGEAGGFISPTSGEGISYALASGEACARAILGGEGALERYTKLATPITRNIRKKLRRLPFLENRYLQRFIDITPSPVLSRITARL